MHLTNCQCKLLHQCNLVNSYNKLHKKDSLILNRMKYELDKKTLTIIINALVFSRLLYCSCVWDSNSKKNISKLQKVQNYGARIITSSRKYDHIQPIFKKSGLFPFESTVKLKDATMMFKYMNGLAPKYLSDKFIRRSDVHSRNTKNKSNLNIPLCKSATGQRSFVYRATTSRFECLYKNE